MKRTLFFAAILASLALLTGCAGLAGTRVELKGFSPEFTARVTAALIEAHKKQCNEGVAGEMRAMRIEGRTPYRDPNQRYILEPKMELDVTAAAAIECK